MRVGSLVKLRFADILWDEGKVVLREAKRGNTFSVIIPEEAMDSIRVYREYREDPLYSKDADTIFISPRTREPLNETGAWNIIRKMAVKAEIEKRVYPHLLRHTHGTIARKHGLALDTIARQLGHQDVSTTQIYARLGDEVYEQEYRRFFDRESQPEQRAKAPGPTVKPDNDIAYR